MSIVSVATATTVPTPTVVAAADADASLRFSTPTAANKHASFDVSAASVHMSLCDSDDSSKKSLAIAETAPTAAAAAARVNNDTNTDITAAINNNNNSDDDMAFTMEGLSYGDASPTSLAELFAMSPFSASSAASSPSDSLDSEREYYVALRDARKQLADKLRTALRSLRQERAVKNGLLRKRYQMRNRNHAAGNGPNPNHTNGPNANTHPGPASASGRSAEEEQQRREQEEEKRPADFASGAAAGSFSASAAGPARAADASGAVAASATATAAGAPKPRPPQKITPTAVAARIGSTATTTKKTGVDKVVESKVSLGGWYDGDYVGMCSSPVSEEFEVEFVEDHADDENAHLVATAAHAGTGVEMVARECHA